MDATRLRAIPAHASTGMGGLAYVAATLSPPAAEGSSSPPPPPSRQQLLVTCGADGGLALRSPADPASTTAADPAAADGAGLTCLAVHPDGERVVVGDDRNFVRVFTLPSLAFDAVATRFTLPPRALAFSPDGAILAAAGDDEGIKLVDLSGGDTSDHPRVLRTLPASPYVRALAFDPDGAFLASITADGHVQVWDVESGSVEASLRKAAAKTDAGSPARPGVAWSTDGALLAVAAPDGDVALYERLAWAPAGTLASGAAGGEEGGPPPPAWSALAFSPNGLYLLAGGRGGAAALWSMSAVDGTTGAGRPPLATARLSGPVSALAWRPVLQSGGDGSTTTATPPPNEAAFLLDDGSLATWPHPVPAGRPGPAVDPDAVSGGMDGAAGADGGGPTSTRGGSVGGDGGTTADMDEDDDGGGSLGEERAYRYASRRTAPSSRPAHRPQKAIQPGSTAGSGRHRWLAYTMLGAISSRAPPAGAPGATGGPRVVEVDFHDASRAVTRGGGRIPILNDYFGFTLGALGLRGALYASPPGPDAAAAVVFRPFAAWAGGGEWAVDLPGGEAAVGLATGAAFSAVATTARLVRLFSTAGLQTGCVSVPGDIVAVAAQGAALAVVWHGWAPARHADQGLAVTLFDGCAGTAVGPPAAPLPLSPGATLTWLGFSEEGLLAAYDSAGVMRVRPVGGLAAAAGPAAVSAAAAAAGPAAVDAASSHWTPVFDSAAARKGAEIFWPVGIAGDSFHCVVCKSDAPEPGERPLVTLEPLRTPALAMGGGGPDADSILALEDSLLRTATTASHWRAASADAAAGLAPPPAAAAADAAVAAAEAAADRALLRLYHAALKAGALERALEAASRLAELKTLQGALKLANALKAPVLAERVAALLTRRMEMEAAEAGWVGGIAPTPGPAGTPAPATYSPATLATAPSGDAVGPAPGAANPFLRAGRTPLAAAAAENGRGGAGEDDDVGEAAAAAAKRKAADAALAAASANPFARGAKAHRA